MFEFIRSPWTPTFDWLISEAQQSLILCAPYIGQGPCKRIADRIHAGVSETFTITILTDLSRDNVVSGATDAAAIADLVRSVSRANVHFLPSLHAKAYVADDRYAVVTSANLTDAGLSRNMEFGVLFADGDAVRATKHEILDYAALGTQIDLNFLDSLAYVAGELREMRRAAERSMRSTLRQAFEQKLREADVHILRARTGGLTAHAIFANAIRPLLRSGPMTTTQIHEGIRRIHPDLCDDLEDRVIDGRHFGKKWKHSVRTAQVFLRRRGEIALEEGMWRLV